MDVVEIVKTCRSYRIAGLPSETLSRLRPLARHRASNSFAKLRAACNRDCTYRVIPRANHSFHLVAPSFLAVTGYAPEYFQTMVQWLMQVTHTREPH
jgi:hypothetical protein